MISSRYMNKEFRHSLNYHEVTKHSEASLLSSRHRLDFASKPIPFKIYLELPSKTLPENFPMPEAKALNCISEMKSQTLRDKAKGLIAASSSKNSDASSNRHKLEISDLAEVLFFSAGITRIVKYPYGKYYMRAASATGALYPIELYVVCDDILPDLEAGVYHFSPADFSLTQIRKGRYRKYLAAAAANNKEIANSSVAIVFTSIAWRNAWKYQARSYRHWFWDSGVIAANLLATAHAMGVPARIVMGFLDDNLTELLCLQDHREAAIAMAAIGSADSSTFGQYGSESERLTNVSTPTIRALSERDETSYPEIWDVNEASKLTSKQEVEDWIFNAHHHYQQDEQSLPTPISPDSQTKGAEIKDHYIIQPTDLEEEFHKSRSLKETILWRGSSRNFSKTAIPLSTLKTILYSSTRGVPMDIFPDGNSQIDIYFIANSVDGLTPGSYFYNRNRSAPNSNLHTSIEKIKELGSSRNISGYLCLGQTLFSNASVVFFLMTDLRSVLSSLGNRGYRTSQFEAGVIAGKIYLASYALRIGASGSTFFDDAVTEFFSPHARNKNTMIAMGVGVPAYNAKPGKVLPARLTKEELLNQDFS